ncbi:MAG TPA: hypothetical protein VGL83_05165 [Stellaceae bacterium]|jgi:hypothetical protein
MKSALSYRRHASMIAEPGRGAVLVSIALVALIIFLDALIAGGGGVP